MVSSGFVSLTSQDNFNILDPQKRKANDWKNDSDDDDEFYDRTSITKEKKQRLSNAKEEKAVLSNENLQGELDKIVEKIKDIDKEIADYNERFKAFKANKEKLNESDLDDFMDNLNAEVADFDTNQIRVLRVSRLICICKSISFINFSTETKI